MTTNLIAPSGVRLGRNFQVIVEYTNQGNTDLLAPVMRLASAGFSELSLFAEGSRSAASLDLIGASATGPAGILPPGATNRIVIYGRAKTVGDERFSLSVGNNPDAPIDWDAIKPTLQTPETSDADFEAVFAELQAIVGATYLDYHQALSAAATLLPPLLGDNRSLVDVFGLIVQRAVSSLTTSVRGRLVLADTDHPVANVPVRLVRTVDPPEILETVSLNDGSFLVSQVPPGDYDVTFEGFVASTPLRVTVESSSVSNITVMLEPASVVEGSVVLAGVGAPVANVLVTAASEEGRSFAARTRRDGSYTLVGLPAGAYVVTAGGDQFTQAQSSPLAVAPGEIKKHVNLSLKPAAMIRGAVSGPAGAVEGAVVTAFGADGLAFTATTDTAGNYAITALPGQAYSVTASAAGLFSPGATPLTLTTGQTVTNVNLSLSRAGRIEGATTAVADQAPVGAVFLEAIGDSASFVTQSDATGAFAFDELPPGEYLVRAFRDDLMSSTATVTIAAGATQVIDLRVAPLGGVTGTVREAVSGQPLPHVVVYLRNAVGVQGAGVTDEQGVFAFDNLDAGAYQVVVGAVDSPGLVEADFTLTQDQTTAAVDLSVPLAGKISGSVLAADGVTPIPFARVVLWSGDDQVASALTDAQGQFRFLALRAGAYRLETSASGLTFSPRAVTLANGSDLTGEDFQAGSAPISGVVRDLATGLPIADASVEIFQERNDVPRLAAVIAAGANGSFTFTGATPGTYHLVVRAVGRGTQARTVIVTSAGVQNIALDLSAPATLRGVIRSANTSVPLADARVVLRNDNVILAELRLTDAAGNYQFEDLAPGDYTLIVQAAGHETVVLPLLAVLAGGELRDVALNVGEIEVSGVVRNAAGAVSGALVLARDANDIVVAEAVTGADGTYSLTTLPPGSYRIRAIAETHLPSNAVPVMVSQGETVANINLDLIAAALAESPNREAPPAMLQGLPEHAAGSLAAPSMAEAETDTGSPAWLTQFANQVAQATFAHARVTRNLDQTINDADESCRAKYETSVRNAASSAGRNLFNLTNSYQILRKAVGDDFLELVKNLKLAPTNLTLLPLEEIVGLVDQYDVAVVNSFEYPRFRTLFPNVEFSDRRDRKQVQEAISNAMEAIRDD